MYVMNIVSDKMKIRIEKLIYKNESVFFQFRMLLRYLSLIS